jgi:Domain of unknown function (DUF4234)
MTDMPPPPPPPSGASGAPSYPPGPPPPPGGFGAAPRTGQLGKRRSAGLVVLLTIVTCGIWAIVWAYQNGDELQRWSGKGVGGVVHLLITILVSPVTMFLMAGEVEQLYRDDGREPPITTLWGLWFLLPLIGNLIWYMRIQDAINAYWTAHGQTNDPSL